MSWTILGVEEWSASDSTDGLPVAGTRQWPAGANTAGDFAVMVLSARDISTPPTGTDDWTLTHSFTSGDADTNGSRNTWVYTITRGASNPAIHSTWVTSYVGGITAYRHSSETTFTVGTPVANNVTTTTSSNTLTDGVSTSSSDTLIIVAHTTGRIALDSISSTTPSTGVTAGTQDTTTAPSTSAWYYRVSRSSGATPGTAFGIADCVINSGSTGNIVVGTSLTTESYAVAFTVIPGTGSTPVSFSGTVSTLNGVNGVAFSESVTSFFSGTLTPFTYTLFSGTLPGWATLSSGGTISGTPNAVATTSGLVVRATDTGANTANTNSFSINITAGGGVTIKAAAFYNRLRG